MKHFVMGERAIFRVLTTGEGQFNLYLPSKGTPGNIAGVLLAVTPRLIGTSSFVGGQLMADFVAAINPAKRCILFNECKLVDYRKVADYQVTLSWHRNGGYCVSCAAIGERGVDTELFVDSMTRFTEWASTYNGYASLEGKVVQFNYDGGSSPGELRTVRVEKIVTNGQESRIEGLDLGVMNLKEGYRQYLMAKVKDLKVLN